VRIENFVAFVVALLAIGSFILLVFSVIFFVRNFYAPENINFDNYGTLVFRSASVFLLSVIAAVQMEILRKK